MAIRTAAATIATPPARTARRSVAAAPERDHLGHVSECLHRRPFVSARWRPKTQSLPLRPPRVYRVGEAEQRRGRNAPLFRLALLAGVVSADWRPLIGHWLSRGVESGAPQHPRASGRQSLFRRFRSPYLGVRNARGASGSLRALLDFDVALRLQALA